MQTSKLKTLLIYKYLEDFSDIEHPVSTTELISMLNEKGISAFPWQTEDLILPRSDFL